MTVLSFHIKATVDVSLMHPSLYLSPSLSLSLSLGCPAAAPGRAGGRRAAAEAGAAEVQHGQRSAGWRECEISHSIPRRPGQAGAAANHASHVFICSQAELKNKLSERNKLISEYEVMHRLAGTLVHLLNPYKLAVEVVFETFCHDSSSTEGRRESCSSRSWKKPNRKHLKSVSDG